IQGEGEWGVTYTSTQICALKGSTVTISCSYKHPAREGGIDVKVEKTFWFTERRGDEYIDLKTVSEYSNRVQDHCEKNDCTLTIRNLRESDSAEYYFRFITNKDKYYDQPGVTLSVKDLDLWVSKYSHQYLQCHSSCPSDQTSYIWYKNRQKLEETSAYLGFTFGSADSYSCALRGYEDFPSPSVYAPKISVVSVSPSAEIMEGTSVTLTCSSDAKPAATYTWYKENGRYLQKNPEYFFSSIQSSDSGQYYCEAENLLGNMKSKHIYLDVK
ncbi:sialoadhesin-like, partial [Plectropomus leopardus]|uniref:sialoadhesin-like n=1 Tax=Plectropomus leopardus TaxID=160734 RepID=UPI001C4CA865